ncbi:Na/Pi cotransporter family protein [Dongia rigui]|uniref:Na/Pi cotransporter family protein n=1 Tax=Dongia rigui TaxID=940149 RepID=A0ABU5E1F4_9PROT|nr:Na/Pi cotransporter family protein [Dongia rigui]MDY0873385.1 Na/Pi cotransporter family protein [Dongia rigui]
MIFLLNLFGAAALLLWGLRMVRTGVLRAYGAQLRQSLSKATGNRFTAFLSGLGITCLLQSSSATALLSASFASRGLVTTAGALAVMLGADLGTSLVAQAYSFKVGWISPLLIVIGWVMFNKFEDSQVKDLGRAIIGLGIALLGLHLITEAAEPIRDAPLLPQILQVMSDAPVFGVLVGAALTVLSTSSLAVVLLVISFMAKALVPIDLGLALILGANLGSAVMPILATSGEPPEARRVPIGNLIFRVIGVTLAVPLIGLVQPYLAALQAEPARQALNYHVAFNLALALIFIWFTSPIARLTARLLPDQVNTDDPSKPRYLSQGPIDQPTIALANAGREALRMGDLVGQMLRQSLAVFRADDRRLIKQVSDIDSQVDRLNEAIKLYLTGVSRELMDPKDQKRVVDLITFITNLEHIGDIVDKNLMELAAKKVKYQLKFSPEGTLELDEIHERLTHNLELAMNVFMSGDIKLARQLFAEKQIFRELERNAAENHLERLRSGRIESMQTSGLHLDILRDLKRINSHLAIVAQPILESAGELSPTRLR